MKNVVIVGRPNVGKSSLFNRIVGRRKAVVEELPGVTRDRLLERAEWAGKVFLLTDTGGYVPSKRDHIENLVAEQVSLAIEEGDIVLLTVDAVEGITALDKEIAQTLRKNGKKVFLVVNKVDNEKRENGSFDFLSLGFNEMFAVSSIHGRGVAELLDALVKLIPEEQYREVKPRIKLAIIGRPNVGKSSFFNSVIKEERVIVDEKPGTTRDAIDTDMRFEGEKITIIDTAGIRRKPKIKTDVEYYTIKRAINALINCDVALVMVDGSVDITRQDKRLIALAGKTAGCILILLNKMDLVPKRMWDKVIQYFRNELPYIPYLFMLPISAKKNLFVFDAIRIAIDGYKRSSQKMNNETLNDILREAVSNFPHKRIGKKRVFMNGCRQVANSPPVVVFYTNFPSDIAAEYVRYLEKKIREHFSLLGIPMVMKFRKRKQ